MTNANMEMSDGDAKKMAELMAARMDAVLMYNNSEFLSFVILAVNGSSHAYSLTIRIPESISDMVLIRSSLNCTAILRSLPNCFANSPWTGIKNSKAKIAANAAQEICWYTK